MQVQEVSLSCNWALASSKADLDKLAAAETGTYKYSVEDYFSVPLQSGLEFLPYEQYLSYEERDATGKNYMYVKNTIINIPDVFF